MNFWICIGLLKLLHWNFFLFSVIEIVHMIICINGPFAFSLG